MGFKRQFRQQCKTCKGTGVSKKILKNKDGQVILAEPYYSPDDKGRPQYEPCQDCDAPGSGMALYDTPHEVLVDGAKIKLEDADRRARFNDTVSV